MQYIKPEELIDLLKRELKESLLDIRLDIKKEGIKQKENHNIWLEIKREQLIDAIKLISTLHYPHISIIAGEDNGENVILTYLMSIYYGEEGKEVCLNIKVKLDIKEPSISTITDIIPGAQTTEREIKEMFGVNFVGLPDMHNIFLPEDFPKNIYPFRKNQKGLDDLIQK